MAQDARTPHRNGRLDGPIGVAVVGCGAVTLGAHIPTYLSMPDEFRVVAIADPTAARRVMAQELLGLADADAYPTFEPLLTRPDVEVVDVCTPPGIRKNIVSAAARAGKHLLSEKPLATVPRDADEMVEAARTAGVTLGVVHNYLFHPEVLAARSIIAEGEIGSVEVVILNYLGVFDNPGSAEYRPGWRHESVVAGGGVLMDMLHVVYVAELLLGEPVRRVSAYVDARDSGAVVEDLALCRLEGESRAALVNIGWGHGPGGLDVSGSEGRLSVRYRDGGTSPFFPFEQLTVVSPNGTRVHAVDAEAPSGYRALFADFARSLREGREPAAPGEQGERALELVLAAYESAALERSVGLPLAREDPVYELGVAGLSQLELPATSRLRQRGIFGLAA